MPLDSHPLIESNGIAKCCECSRRIGYGKRAVCVEEDGRRSDSVAVSICYKLKRGRLVSCEVEVCPAIVVSLSAERGVPS